MQRDTRNTQKFYYQAALNSYNKKWYVDAMDACKQVIKLNDENDQAYHLLGLIYEAQKNVPDAIPCFDKAIAINSKNDQAQNSRGLIYVNQQNFSKALDCFHKAIEISPENETYNFRYAYALYMNKDYWDAITAFINVLSINHENEKSNRFIGLCYSRLELFNAAIQYFIRAINLNSGNSVNYYNAGLAFYRWGKLAAAKEFFAKTILLDPKNSDAQTLLQQTIDRQRKECPKTPVGFAMQKNERLTARRRASSITNTLTTNASSSISDKPILAANKRPSATNQKSKFIVHSIYAGSGKKAASDASNNTENHPHLNIK